MEYKILLLDDEPTRFMNVANGLIAKNIETAVEESCFQGHSIYKYEDHENFCKDIKNRAEDKFDLYSHVFKIIENEEINIVFIDAYLKDDDDVDTKEVSGLDLVVALRANRLHKNLPIIIYSRKIREVKKLYSNHHVVGNIEFMDTAGTTNDPAHFRDKFMSSIFRDKYLKFIEDYSSREFDYNLAVICALTKEYKYVEELLKDISPVQDSDNKKYKQGYISNEKSRIILKVVVRDMRGDVGDFGAINDTRNILSSFKPKYVAMTGIAAGHRDSVNLGDVVIVRQSYNWHQTKITKEGVLNRTHPLVIDKKLYHIIHEHFTVDEKNYLDVLLESYKDKATIKSLIEKEKDDEDLEDLEYKHNGKLSLHFGAFASGSTLVADGNTARKIKELNDKSKGLDMEIYEVYKAVYIAHNINTQAIAIKGIVDYMDSNKGDSWHEFASYMSAQTLYKLFTEYIDVGSN